MNAHPLILTLNPTSKIISYLKDPLSSIGLTEEEPIFFMHNNTSIMLADGPIFFNIKDLRDILKKALNYQLLIHNSINADIGYLCNEYNENETSFLSEQSENGLPLWIGYRYYLWETYNQKKKYITWMYNDHDHNIIFEITPSYPYRYCDQTEKGFIAYKSWIAQYEPYFITTLSKNIAQQWLDQTEHIIKTIETNITQ